MVQSTQKYSHMQGVMIMEQTQTTNPEQEGMISGLLEGSMRDRNEAALIEILDWALENNVQDLQMLYELAQEDHPQMPTWDEIMDKLEGTSQEVESDETTVEPLLD